MEDVNSASDATVIKMLEKARVETDSAKADNWAAAAKKAAETKAIMNAIPPKDSSSKKTN